MRASAVRGRYSMRQRLVASVRRRAKRPDQEDEVRQGEEGEGDPEVEEKVVVERGAVSAGVGGQEPRWGEQKRGVAGRARLAGERHTSRISCLSGDSEGVSRVFR